MSIPLFDPIDLPPGYVLMDVNGLPDDERNHWQGVALQIHLDEVFEDPTDFEPIEWSDDEGIFVICEIATEEIVGVAIVTGVEDAA